jgi:hypothetical protein
MDRLGSTTPKDMRRLGIDQHALTPSQGVKLGYGRLGHGACVSVRLLIFVFAVALPRLAAREALARESRARYQARSRAARSSNALPSDVVVRVADERDLTQATKSPHR